MSHVREALIWLASWVAMLVCMIVVLPVVLVIGIVIYGLPDVMRPAWHAWQEANYFRRKR